MRKADHIRITMSDDGTFIESSDVTSDPLTRIMVDDVNLSMVEVAKFSAQAQERAAFELMDTGTVVIHGVSKSDRVFDRFATLQAEIALSHAVQHGVKADRPQSASEAKAQAHAELKATVAAMQADDEVSNDDIIAMLLNG